MLVLKDAFYKWLTKDSISDKECRRILEAIDGICKEITTDELQFIHRIIEGRCIDIGYALSKYHFFSNIQKNARITNEYEVIVDKELDPESENPVSNDAIAKLINEIWEGI